MYHKMILLVFNALILEMFDFAYKKWPEHKIVIKIHPDVINSRKKGYFDKNLCNRKKIIFIYIKGGSMNILKLKYFLALTLTLGLFNIDIVAQDAEEDVEEVIVTGSRILNDEFASSSPVTIISDEDILAGGNASVDEFLKYTPAFTGYQLGTSTNNGGDGSRKVDLRGLGSVSYTHLTLPTNREV
mgnify:CR=1 FL=1